MASGYLHPVGLDSLEVCRVNPALRYLEAGFFVHRLHSTYTEYYPVLTKRVKSVLFEATV